MRAAIVLAGGASRRFGRADKLIASLHGRPLLAHAIARAKETGAQRIILVVRRHDRLRRGIRNRRLRVVVARDAGTGMSASLRAGLAALRPIEREAWIFLGDMPFAAAPRRIRLREGEAAARPVVGAVPGHPMLVRTARARSLMLRGDRGLGALPVRTWPGDRGNILDIDTVAALRRARLRAR